MTSISSKNLCNKSSTSSRSASTIGNNSNLLIDILYCLPGKTLCVFKTVSKQCLSLISDPCFVRNYNLRSRRLSMPALFIRKIGIDCPTEYLEFQTLVMDEENGVGYVPFKTPIVVTGIRVSNSCINFEQSCNGLILCTIIDDHHTPPLVICNPSMKHCKTFPSPPLGKTGVPRLLGATIAFDPEKSSYYEVVGVCNIGTDKDIMYQIEIYSSKTDSWRAAGYTFYFSAKYILWVPGVYWNGSVHWIDEWSATLHYFVIDCEVMKAIAMPTQPRIIEDHTREIVYFRECRGHIYLMVMRKDVEHQPYPRLDIWEMRMDYTGWNVKYVDLNPIETVHRSLIQDRFSFYSSFDFHVLFVEEGEDSSRLILWIDKDKVISFDLKNKSIKKMYDVKPGVWIHGFEYIETLAHA